MCCGGAKDKSLWDGALRGRGKGCREHQQLGRRCESWVQLRHGTRKVQFPGLFNNFCACFPAGALGDCLIGRLKRIACTGEGFATGMRFRWLKLRRRLGGVAIGDRLYSWGLLFSDMKQQPKSEAPSDLHALLSSKSQCFGISVDSIDATTGSPAECQQFPYPFQAHVRDRRDATPVGHTSDIYIYIYRGNADHDKTNCDKTNYDKAYG